jgi:hypothetical protein
MILNFRVLHHKIASSTFKNYNIDNILVCTFSVAEGVWQKWCIGDGRIKMRGIRNRVEEKYMYA